MIHDIVYTVMEATHIEHIGNEHAPSGHDKRRRRHNI